MQRFIARQNIERFQRLLTEGADPRTRRFLKAKICETRRELALLDSAAEGVPTDLSSGPSRGQFPRISSLRGRLQAGFEMSAHPYLLLDPRPGLHIVDVNEAYVRATMVSRAGVAGERLFEVFPDNPDDPRADGVSNLYNSLCIAAETTHPHEMSIQKYDVRNPTGMFIRRFWKLINTPIFDDDGKLLFILHGVEDVTARFKS